MKLKYRYIFLFMSILFSGCHNEGGSDIKLKSEIKTITTKSILKNIKYKDEAIDWKKAIKLGESYYIPLSKIDFSFAKMYNKNNNAKLIPYILFEKNSDNMYSERIILFADFKKNKELSQKEILKLPYFKFDYENTFLESTFTESNSVGLKSVTDCVEWGLYLIEYIDGQKEEELLYSFIVCDEEQEGEDDGEGGGGASADITNPIEDFLNSLV